MKKYGRTDDNHPEIVEALRKTGHSVVSLASLGGGIPDLLVGRNGINCLLEVKDGSKPPSQRKLTDSESGFITDWRGQVSVVTDIQSALDAVNRALPKANKRVSHERRMSKM